MKEIFEALVRNVPDYKEFLTVDELDASSKALAEAHPEVCSFFEFGKTKENKPLYCLKIGDGSEGKNALMFGCPHPNEPIGTMMLEYLSKNLAENAALRRELGYTWYIVKAWDADGLRLNEKWLKGPYTIYNYSRNFFRPAGHKQVDWTFPIDYKELHFHSPVPETSAMMKLIDEIKPHFIYSLHNAGFGGVYWYMSEGLPALYDEMYAAAARVNVPRNLGEPEAPYCVSLAPAVYQSLGIEQEYDYLEKFGEKDIGSKINVGNCSETYARERYKSYTLLTELPYFFDKRITDMSEGTMLRRDAVTENLDMGERGNAYLRSALDKTRGYIDPENPFLLAIDAFTKGSSDASTRKMIAENPDFARKATVAEEFDNILMSRFYKSLSYGMIIRMNELELERMKERGEHDPEKEKALRAAVASSERAHRELTDELEEKLDYEVVPIRKLVSIQLECGLLVADYLKDKNVID